MRSLAGLGCCTATYAGKSIGAPTKRKEKRKTYKNMARMNMLATVTAGAPQNVCQLLLGYNPAAGAMSATPIPSYQPVYATRVFIQMATGGSGKGIIFDGVPLGVTPTDSNYGDITAELAPATSTTPGGSYSDATPGHLVGAPQIDLRRLWIDGSHSGDGIRVSAYVVD